MGEVINFPQSDSAKTTLSTVDQKLSRDDVARLAIRFQRLDHGLTRLVGGFGFVGMNGGPVSRPPPTNIPGHTCALPSRSSHTRKHH